jgi:type III pantothenate kinase
MILAIDSGNTRTKWGLRDADRWIATGAVAASQAASLAASWPVAAEGSTAVASNVAGAGVQAAIEAACAARGLPLQWVRAVPQALGVRNGYRDAGQLGADRWVALLAAHGERACDQLVVNAGTALTVDALTASGEFLGGLIVPGPALMRRSLDHGTAGLRLTEGTFEAFPRATPDAITSGALQACAGAVARMADAMASRGAAPQRMIVSGGAAAELAPHLPAPCVVREHLVLDGLVLIARDR